MGGGSSPKPDPKIGEAALKSAEVGEKLMGWMQDQAKITNQWAEEDRSRWTDVFKPLQDQYISDAKSWDSAGRKNARAGAAQADTRIQARLTQGANERRAMALGVNPASGAFQSSQAKAGVDTSLAALGAGNIARRQVEQEAEGKMANAINMGSGLAVNPGTSMGISNGAMQSGASGAMSGYGQQGSLLNTQYQQQMQAHQANQGGLASLFGGLGSMAGLIFSSSKGVKTDKTKIPEGAALGAVRDMPVEEWTYKPGAGDGGRHIGPYAEDFHKATGRGDGKSIPAQDLLGVTLGAVRDLDEKVTRMMSGKHRKAA